jgi:hypothetical protein
MNHEATTDEKLSSFFLHANGGTSGCRACVVDKSWPSTASVVEMRMTGQQWACAGLGLQLPHHH